MHAARLGLTAWWQGWGWVARLTWGLQVAFLLQIPLELVGVEGARGRTQAQTVQLLLNKTNCSSILSGAALFAGSR